MAIWVDQLCINQSNDTEKASQLPLMGDIYSRAKTVRLWLGNHLGPRWVEEADDLDWFGEWAIAHAKRYPLSSRYWLYLLTKEEYWTRTWIIQEVGMASNIQVHFGHSQSIPWKEFIKIMEWYREYDPKANVQNILRPNAVRETMYRDKASFSLGYLLTEFYDNHCTEPIDKIFAFLRMANECRGGCIDIDYSKSKREVYEDIITTLNISSDATYEIQMHMVNLANIIRRSLERKSVQVPKTLEYFGRAADPRTSYYHSCGDERAPSCFHGNGSLNAKDHDAISCDRSMDFVRWLWHLIVRKRRERTSVWLPETPESHDVWLRQSDSPMNRVNSDRIQVRGVVTGQVGSISPSFSSFISDVKVSRRWAADLDFYQNPLDRREAMGLNDKLMSLLSVSPYALIKGVGPLRLTADEDHDDLNLFRGSPVMAGLVPSMAVPGDLIIQFLGSNAAIVVRNRTDNPGNFQVLGRALVVKSGDFDWDSPRDKTMFQENSSSVVDLSLDIMDLTLLSFNTMTLGYY